MSSLRYGNLPTVATDGLPSVEVPHSAGACSKHPARLGVLARPHKSVIAEYPFCFIMCVRPIIVSVGTPKVIENAIKYSANVI